MAKKYQGLDNHETVVTYVVRAHNQVLEDFNLTRFVSLLEIVVNEGLFEDVSRIKQVNYKDLIPYVVEHDVYEAWLSAKRGAGQTIPVEIKHLLARRREFYLATREGKGQKLYDFHMFITPSCKEEYQAALDYAKRRLKNSESRSVLR